MTDLTHRDPAAVALPFTQTLAVQLTGRQRLSVILRPLYAFPSSLYVAFYLGLGLALAPLAWLAILFTGRYPPEIYKYNVGVVRMVARQSSYLLLAHDVAPPLDGDPSASYPLQLELPPLRETHDRRAIALLPLRAIPVLVRATLTALIGFFHAIHGAVAILFTGQLPPTCAEPLRDAIAAITRAHALPLLMLEDPLTLRASA